MEGSEPGPESEGADVALVAEAGIPLAAGALAPGGGGTRRALVEGSSFPHPMKTSDARTHEKAEKSENDGG